MFIIVLFCFTSCTEEKTPSDTVKSFFSHMQNGHYRRALSCTNYSEEDVDLIIDEYKSAKYRINQYEILSESVSEKRDSAVVLAAFDCSVNFYDNQEIEIDNSVIKLVFVNGEWKICEMLNEHNHDD